MSTVKKGTVCELTEDYCGFAAGTKLVVAEGESEIPYCHDLNGNCLNSFPTSLLRPLSGLDALKRGDVVTNVNGDRRTLLGVCGDAYIMSSCNNQSSVGFMYTISEMKDNGFKVATPQEPDDATAEAMALLKSKGFKVVKETV